MIIHSYDTGKSLTDIRAFYGEPRHLCDKCIATFSDEIYRYALDKYDCREVAEMRSANGTRKIHIVDFGKITAAFYLSNIGSALAGTEIIEVNHLTGAGKFIIFGSAGSLDKEKTSGKYIIPTEAYRDEGLSYHYAPPADFIKIKTADKTAQIFSELKLPYVMGKVWTTDAFYRETAAKMKARRDDGCIAVDMEFAGAEAVCDFHGIELYGFLVTGDVLSESEYDRAELHIANHSLDKFHIAIELAKRI